MAVTNEARGTITSDLMEAFQALSDGEWIERAHQWMAENRKDELNVYWQLFDNEIVFEPKMFETMIVVRLVFARVPTLDDLARAVREDNLEEKHVKFLDLVTAKIAGEEPKIAWEVDWICIAQTYRPDYGYGEISQGGCHPEVVEVGELVRDLSCISAENLTTPAELIPVKAFNRWKIVRLALAEMNDLFHTIGITGYGHTLLRSLGGVTPETKLSQPFLDSVKWNRLAQIIESHGSSVTNVSAIYKLATHVPLTDKDRHVLRGVVPKATLERMNPIGRDKLQLVLGI